jgi:hypothetical protein
MSRSQGNIKVEPQEVFFAQVQTDCIAVAGESGGNLDGKYWIFSSPEVNYYVWYNVDGASTDPAVPSKTGIEVEIDSGDTAAQVATATVDAINGVSGLLALVDPKNTSNVILKVLKYAPGVHAANGNLTPGLFTFVPIHDGFFHDFGFTEGDLELTVDQQLLDVTAHQAGTEILTALVTGMNVELTVALKEVTDEQLTLLIEKTTGGSFTPVNGEKLQGYGSGQNFINVLDKAGRLILHPAAKPRTDYSEDLCCWLAYPKVDSFLFSGENPRLLNVTFRVFKDEFLPKNIDKVAVGDHTQL